MKRFRQKESLVILLFLGIIILSVFVVAENNCSSESQIILSLYGQNNTHGALWNVSEYNEKVCFNDVFGYTYSGANPHLCNGNNKILKLTNIMNSHAYDPAFDLINSVDVCYGNLVCSARLNCNPNERPIISMSNLTNAHFASNSTYYPYKVCCYTLGGNSSVYWADMAGNGITQAQVGDSVMMTVLMPGVVDETHVEFNIYEGNSLISNFSAFVASGRARAIWAINNTEIAKVGDKTSYQFYFKVRSGSYSNESGTLGVTKQTINSPPVASITSPVNLCTFYTGRPILFNHSSYDIDDSISVNWSIDDTLDVNTAKTNSFQHTYVSGGQKNIKLTVTDSRGAISVKTVSIYVIGLEANKIYSIISTPRDGEIISGSAVYFNGNKSFAVKNSQIAPATPTLECLGGACPQIIEVCHQDGFQDENISVIDPNNKRGDYSMLNFSWTFGDDSATPLKMEGIGLFNGLRYYQGYGSRKIALMLGLGNISSQTENNFILSREGGCYDNGNNWYESSSGQSFSTALPNVCNGFGALTTSSCCPRGKICSSTPAGTMCDSAGCITTYIKAGNESEITLCDHYNNLDSNIAEKQCEADCNIAWNSNDQKAINVQLRKNGYTAKKCVWKNDECRLETQKVTVNPDDGRIIDDETCVIISTDGICIDGTKTITYSSTCLSGESGSVQASCNSSPIKLPFFGLFGFIMSGLIVSVLYWIKIND